MKIFLLDCFTFFKAFSKSIWQNCAGHFSEINFRRMPNYRLNQTVFVGRFRKYCSHKMIIKQWNDIECSLKKKNFQSENHSDCVNFFDLSNFRLHPNTWNLFAACICDRRRYQQQQNLVRVHWMLYKWMYFWLNNKMPKPQLCIEFSIINFYLWRRLFCFRILRLLFLVRSLAVSSYDFFRTVLFLIFIY